MILTISLVDYQVLATEAYNSQGKAQVTITSPA
jgi:hypothetical protein